MNIWEIRKVFEAVIVDELMETSKALNELSKKAKAWHHPPKYPQIPKEIQIAPNAILFVSIAPADGTLRLKCKFEKREEVIYHESHASVLARDLLLRVGYEPREAKRILDAISSIRAWAIQAQNEIEGEIRKMFEEQIEEVEFFLAEWSMRRLSDD